LKNRSNCEEAILLLELIFSEGVRYKQDLMFYSRLSEKKVRGYLQRFAQLGILALDQEQISIYRFRHLQPTEAGTEFYKSHLEPIIEYVLHPDNAKARKKVLSERIRDEDLAKLNYK
jgi:hypothetical protein